MKASIKRAREGGQLSSPAAFPLTEQETAIPKNYKANIFEFFIPLLLIISISVSTFIINRTPNILMAFSLAVTFSMVTAFIKGMQLKDIINGLVSGLKQSSLGLLILLLAFTIGNITIQTGAGVFIVNLIGNSVPYWIMPLLLYLISVVIAFSTGTSWGTYAIAFPIAMPLAWAVAQYSGLGNPELFMTICFACVMDGAVYGDQCSPISDTTVLSAMCTGCGLMEHVKTQIPQATLAAGLAMICWSICMLFV